jgi:D-alanyl-D-alanine carboxypeptidase
MRKTIGIIIVFLGIVALGFWWHTNKVAAPAQNTTTTNNSQPSTTIPSFDKAMYSNTDPSSLWVVVNKQHPLTPVSYTPTDLRTPRVTLRVAGAAEMQMRSVASTALENMFAAAQSDGYKLQISTAYRGYAYQKNLYDSYVAKNGQTAADKVSARPGYSEHQTGWAVDIRGVPDVCGLKTCFGDTPEGKWLAANAHTYGFLLRYPASKVSVTGYEYEPWHFRYIGTDLSEKLFAHHIETLEEFFGVTGSTVYN